MECGGPRSSFTCCEARPLESVLMPTKVAAQAQLCSMLCVRSYQVCEVTLYKASKMLDPSV